MKRGAEPIKSWSIEDRLVAHEVPGVAVAIIENGEVVWAKGYGTSLKGSGIKVDADTVFSVGSVSKMINAALILRLAAEKKVDLDTDVNTYLKSWKVPENHFTKVKKVTLRSILSHTAGFNQHGFDDYLPGEALPNALDT
jgi:CubicO group peptidase (beta-lactamase class C family)